MEEIVANEVINSSFDAIITLRLDGIITSWNPAAEKMYEYQSADAIGQPISIIVPSGNREEMETILKKLAVGEQLESRNTRCKTKSDHQINVSISVSPIKETNNMIVGATIIARDTRHEIQMEGKFRRILEGTPDAMIMINKNGVITFNNKQTEKVFGYEKNELLGQEVEVLIPEQYQKNHPGHRGNYFHDPHPRPMGAEKELLAQRKNGETFPVEISLSPLNTREGMLIAAAIRDISEQKRMREQLKELVANLERSNQELEHFAHVASHDLQEPLRMISSYMQLLEKRYFNKLDDQAKEFIHFAIDGAVRLQQLITDLLEYSRVSTQSKPFTVVDCNEVAQQALHLLQIAIEESHTNIECGPLPNIMGDFTQMLQLFQNLINNAIKFRGERTPHIRITAELIEKDWEFRIADNGIGISPEYFKKVFEIFQRLHSRDTYPGTGIGLAICKKIVERHGGKMWIESTVGEGTTMCFTLPKM